MNRQGGKQWGKLKEGQKKQLDDINDSYLAGGKYEDVENLPDKLLAFRDQFMEFDDDNSGDIDMMELKRMMEKLGQAKTHLELKKMIAEVDSNDSGTIHYHEFLDMMLGKRSTILKIILMFEAMNKDKAQPTGIAPKKSLADLP